MISEVRRREIIDALRRGTVPQRGLDTLAVGLEHFTTAIDDELSVVEQGGAVFKAVRGEYGSGKTFMVRWIAERAKQKSFATSEIQISETETPLHRLETVYRRITERLATADVPGGALRSVLDGWFYALEQDALAEGTVDERDTQALISRTNQIMEQRLSAVSRSAPAFATALRGYREAGARGDTATTDGLLAWIGGEPHVAASVKRAANLRGDLDHFGALGFLQGLLTVLRDSGHPGLLVILDEVETLQRVRTDVREKSLNALRQLIDEVDAGRFPGLYLLITGTPAFFDGPQGIQRLPPLAQRLHVDFPADTRFDNPRAVQLRLRGFDEAALLEVGQRVRDLYAGSSPAEARVHALANDALLADLASAVTGELGGRVGVAPRIYLKKLVAGVLDPIELHEEFDPRRDYALTVTDAELTPVERNARRGQSSTSSLDDVELDLNGITES